jgi:hypothetical protein
MLISDRMMARYNLEKSPNVQQHIGWVSMLSTYNANFLAIKYQGIVTGKLGVPG